MTEHMEDNTKLLESLLERVSEYGKTSFELIKLKTLDKTTDVVSSLVPQSVVIILIISFMLFLNVGIALWLGDLLGKPFLGFFVVAAFYLLVGFVIHFFMHNWIKKVVGNYLIKRVLK
jgi:fatty acid desaturase